MCNLLELHKRIIKTAETSLCPAAVMHYCLYLAGIDTHRPWSSKVQQDILANLGNKSKE